MSQSQNILKNTVVLALSRVVERASALLLAFFVARFLGATGLGIYSAAMVYYGIIFLAAEMGSTNFLVREIAKEPARTSRYVVHIAVMVIVLSIAAVALSLVIVPHLGYSPELTASIYVIVLAVLPGTLKTIQEAAFVAHQRVEFVTYTALVAAMLNVGVSLYLLNQGYGIVSLVAAFVIVQCVNVVLYFFFLHRYITSLRWEFSFSFSLSLIKEIRAFAGSSLLGGLFARPEIIVLSLLKNEAEIGFYSAALRVVDFWQVIAQTYMANVLPVLSRAYHVGDAKPQSILDKSVKYLLAVSLPLAVGILVAAEPIVRLLYGPGFGPSVSALRVMVWTIPLTFLFSILWRVLVARDQQDAMLRIQLITTVARLGGGCLLIWWLASFGAAITTLAILLVHDLLLALYLRRDKTQLGVFRVGWRLGVATTGMGVFTWMLSRHLKLWALVPVAVAIYVTFFLALKAFSADDLAPFRRMWRSIVRAPTREII